MVLKVKGLKFVQTCEISPEQYNVLDSHDNQVGYVRLRWGELRCDIPDCGGKTIFANQFDDDLKGCFDSDAERNYFLGKIADEINRRREGFLKRIFKSLCKTFSEMKFTML